MKRILPLILTVLLLPALLVVPAYADEVSFDQYWINYLDYGYLNQSDGSNYFTFSFGQYGIPLNNISNTYYNFVDIVLKTDCSDLQFSVWGDFNPSLSKVSLGNGYYRFFGSISRSWTNQSIYYKGSDGTYIDFLSFKFASFPDYQYVKAVSGMVHNYATSPATQTFISYTGEPSNQVIIDSSSAVDNNAIFRADLDIDQWQTMDYIHLSVSSFCSSIDSIQIVQNGVSVPSAIGYLNINKRSGTGLALIDITIDVSQLDRLSAGTLVVQIAGTVIRPHQGNFVIQHCTGAVTVEPPSLWTHWFTKIISLLNSGFTNLAGQVYELKNVLVGWVDTLPNIIQTGFSSVSSSLVSIYDSIRTGFSSVGTWFTSQTNSITSVVSSWGQSIKDSIDALPDKIAEALQALFVPSDSALQDFGESSQQIAQDRFGGVYEGAVIVDDFAGQLKAQAATQILTVPVVTLNILGSPFPLGGWDIDLVPEGSDVLIEAVKLIIDIIATLAFINGIKSRLERTLEQ